MTRDEFEDTKAFAVAAMIGLLSRGDELGAQEVATRSFDLALAFQAEKQKRIGELPPYDM
ncbi:hypothetical protein B0E42_13115 [Pseudomonas sp. A25(2017)]|uniref:hypothetical protein n=1 Tax=Pseudomonas sp. A25(2017) TaxID=1945865 RepID=UPI000986D91C|nr:hypothetical protein [Pseudomonas sp. A25(2017)]OOG85736.1 hypothetical protein B0E42_13115 [Pseudomonas sp. A25(2017)]